MGQPCLTPILQLSPSYLPSKFLDLTITLSYNRITTTFNSKGTFSSSNIFQRLLLAIVSNSFRKSTVITQTDILLLYCWVIVIVYLFVAFKYR